MRSYTGKRFVTKSSFYGVLDSYWSDRKQEQIEIHGNVWGVWDKVFQGWVCDYGNVIVEDTNRAVMVELADELNRDGYYGDLQPQKD